MYQIFRKSGGVEVISTFCLNYIVIMMLMAMQERKYLKRSLMCKTFRKIVCKQNKAPEFEVYFSE